MLNSNTDLLVIIDMNNGFVNEGALSSVNVRNLVPKMTRFVNKFIDDGGQVIHYSDSHLINSKEFDIYPMHCIEGTIESQIIEELDLDQIEVIKKNSTNGFLVKNPFIYKKNVYIIGCVSDICVYQFALTARKYVDEVNLSYSVNIIGDLVATFDGDNHDAVLAHEKSMNELAQNGINIVNSNI